MIENISMTQTEKDWFNIQFAMSVQVGTQAFEFIRQIYQMNNVAIRVRNPIKLLSLYIGGYTNHGRCIVRAFDCIRKDQLYWSEDFKTLIGDKNLANGEPE